MARVMGVDGCKDSWVAIVLQGGAFETAFLEKDIGSVLERASDVSVVAVDIPIGSEPDGFRRVDVAARTFLGPRANSVFRVPPLRLFDAANYEEATALCRELTGESRRARASDHRSAPGGVVSCPD